MRPALRRAAALYLAGVLTLVFALSACTPLAPSPSSASPAASGEWLTESDEPAVRQRARLHLALALAYFQQEQDTVALDEIKRGLLLDPGLMPLHRVRGLVYQRLGEPRLAEASLRQALALSPLDADTLQNLGWVLCQQARPDEALPLLARAVATPGLGSAKAWMTQGLCQKQAGLKAQAEQSLQRALALEPANGLVTYELAQLLYERSNWSGASAQLSRLNASPGATASSLWLAIRAERRLDNSLSVQQLGSVLRSRFAPSPEALAFERALFHD